ncbi:MAG: hypothetical protein ABIP97_10815 [Chthoniobacterales bacterium]
MRRFCVSALLIACGIFAGTLQTRADDFLNPPEGTSTLEMIRLLERENTKDKPVRDWSFSTLFSRACSQATEQEYPALLNVYRKLPTAESYQHAGYFASICALATRLEIAKIQPAILNFPAAPKSEKILPKDFPPELARYWEFYRTLEGPLRALVENPVNKPTIGVQTNEENFTKLLDAMLLTPGQVRVEDFLRFRWSGWCGTGSDMFYVPLSQAVFLALLQEKRYQEAAGAALNVYSNGMLMERRSDFGVDKFLRRIGVDTEEAAIGALVDTDILGNYKQNREGLLQTLGGYGTEKSVRLLMELATYPKPTDGENGQDNGADYARVLAAFVSPQPLKDVWFGSSSSYTILRYNATPVPEKTQQDILRLFGKWSAPDTAFATTEKIAWALHTLHRRDTIPILKRMLQHPSPSVVKDAKDTLELMGESVKPPPAPVPVSFVIKVNGKPYANAKVNWIVGGKKRSLRSGTDSQTDGRGVIKLERQYLTDPAFHPTNIGFYTPQGTSPGDMIFEKRIPTPEKLDVLTVVNIATRPFDIHFKLPRSADFFKGRKISLSLQMQTDEELFMGIVEVKAEIAAGENAHLNLQPGVYQLKVYLHGAETYLKWNMPIDGGALDVSLNPGVDVTYKLKLPENPSRYSVTGELLCGGKVVTNINYYDPEPGVFNGLPYGKYVFRVASSMDQREKNPDRIPDGIEFAQRDVPFEINADTPAVLELGEISLK